MEAEIRIDAEMPHATWAGAKSEFRLGQFRPAPRHSARFGITPVFPNCLLFLTTSRLRPTLDHLDTTDRPTKKSKMSFQPPAQHEQFQHILRLLNTNVKGTGENLRPIVVPGKRADSRWI